MSRWRQSKNALGAFGYNQTGPNSGGVANSGGIKPITTIIVPPSNSSNSNGTPPVNPNGTPPSSNGGGGGGDAFFPQADQQRETVTVTKTTGIPWFLVALAALGVVSTIAWVSSDK